MSALGEVRGVRLGDVFRDDESQLWEVVGICTEPTATVRRVVDSAKETHVIGCLNWESKWKEGPMRAESRP